MAGLDGCWRVPEAEPYHVVMRCYGKKWEAWLTDRKYERLLYYLGRGWNGPRWFLSQSYREAFMSYLRKKIDAKVQREDSGKPVDECFALEYPALYEYMTATTHEGKARQTSTLSIFVRGDRFVAILNDREEGYSLWSESEDYGRLLSQLEASLKMDSPPWRKNLDYDPKRSRKKS